MVEQASLEEIASRILDSGAVSVRDVDAGEEPFVYSTGNRGPGYVMIKGLVGQRRIMKFLTMQLAHKVAPLFKTDFDFVEGNATGGMIPHWQLTDDLEAVLGLEPGSIPYAYLREARKEGGHGELITGITNNPEIRNGMKVLIGEELVNYAGTTTNAAKIFREAGFPATDAATILFYDTPDSNARLQESNLRMNALITLPQLIDAGERLKKLATAACASYRDFLRDPMEWQLNRRLVVPTDTAERAIDRGYQMRELGAEEAIRLGAPEGKVNKDKIVYWTKETAT